MESPTYLHGSSNQPTLGCYSLRTHSRMFKNTSRTPPNTWKNLERSREKWSRNKGDQHPFYGGVRPRGAKGGSNPPLFSFVACMHVHVSCLHQTKVKLGPHWWFMWEFRVFYKHLYMYTLVYLYTHFILLEGIHILLDVFVWFHILVFLFYLI